MKNLENPLSLKKTNKLLLLTGLISTCKANCASFFFLWFFLSLCYLVSLCSLNKQKVLVIIHTFIFQIWTKKDALSLPLVFCSKKIFKRIEHLFGKNYQVKNKQMITYKRSVTLIKMWSHLRDSFSWPPSNRIIEPSAMQST